jgi:zinc D-Ala-D-Ala carboxypeptidase
MKLQAHRGDRIPGWRWENFTPDEFASDNGAIELETDFLDRLQELRRRFKRPMVVTSGYRTPEHNQRVAKTGAKGPHTTGRAVDIRVTHAKARYQLIALAIDCGFTGIGVGKGFVHLDDIRDNPDIPRPAVWTY